MRLRGHSVKKTFKAQCLVIASLLLRYWYHSVAIRIMYLRCHSVQLIFATWSITILADFPVSFSSVHWCLMDWGCHINNFERQVECQAFSPVVRNYAHVIYRSLCISLFFRNWNLSHKGLHTWVHILIYFHCRECSFFLFHLSHFGIQFKKN